METPHSRPRGLHKLRQLLFGWLTLLLCAAVYAQGPAMKPGVTVWIYDLGQDLRALPRLVDGQTPNTAGDYQALDFTGAWPSTYGAPIQDHYLGHAWGKMVIPTGGTYEFRLTSDDGAKFFMGQSPALVIDNDQPGLNSREATLSLLAGSYPFYVDFYQNTGGSRVLLEWKPPGATAFVPVPTSALQTEDGQVHVTSPGVKNFYYEDGEGGTAGGPGDGRPLIGVHPSFNLINFRPSGFQPRVGGLDFLPDGRLAVCTWDSVGAVYLMGNLNGSGPATVQKFAEGLGEPLGLKVVNGTIYVAQKQEITKLVDVDGDGIADEYTAIAHGWPASFNYHEFTFNLVHKDGYFWATTSTPLRTGDTAYLPGSHPAYPVPDGPGSLLRIDEQNRSWQIMANGMRTPNGLGLGVDGEMFQADNQGCWLPSSKLNHIQAGAFYGHQESATGTVASKAPALWLPHGEISNSPAQPILIPSGTYAGQMLVAELTHGGVNRVAMEKINGEYQGVVFQFTQGLESGMNRLVWGPDGSLYAGGLGSGGNWNWQGKTFGLQKLQPNGHTTFEMYNVRSRADGFIIEFTQPVPYSIAAAAGNYQVTQYSYTPTITYGGPKIGEATRTVTSVSVSQDRKKVFLKIPSLANGQVTYFRLKNFVNDSQTAPWATEAWYTLNQRSSATGPDFVPMSDPVGSNVPVAPAQSWVYEAEDAALSGPVKSTVNAGYNGSGYADYSTTPTSGESIQWTVNASHAGAHSISFRYANGSTADRPLQIKVNGAIVASGFSFAPTANWVTYGMTAPLAITLNKGSNTITATSTGSSGANVDYLQLTGPPIPPQEAFILFDGTVNSRDANWRRDNDGVVPNWPVSNGAMVVSLNPAPNDISTIQPFKDFQLHAEWLSPAGGTGQLAGNSGVKLQRSYELQILNTPANTSLTSTDAGGIYNLKPASANASLGAGQWQSYDVYFTAARWSEGAKISNARVTALWNGVLVHDNVEIPTETGASAPEAPGLQSLMLQAHDSSATGPVQFRNIWVIPANTFEQQWASWVAGYNLTGADADPYADPDHDGVCNRWEYASGGNPLVADRNQGGQSLTPQMTLIEEEEARYLEFSFLRRKDAAARGLRVTMETSDSLAPGSWQNEPYEEVGAPVPVGDGSIERCKVRATTPLAPSTQQLFGRLKAEILQ